MSQLGSNFNHIAETIKMKKINSPIRQKKKI